MEFFKGIEYKVYMEGISQDRYIYTFVNLLSKVPWKVHDLLNWSKSTLTPSPLNQHSRVGLFVNSSVTQKREIEWDIHKEMPQ